jgi:hypothetical protein
MLVITAGLSGCGTQRTPAQQQASAEAKQELREQAKNNSAPQNNNRPMILWKPGTCADLYWNGQITDSKGYRWDVFIIPGIAPPLSGAYDSYARSGGYIRRYGTDGFFSDGRQNKVGELYEYAGPICIGDYMIGGIGRDYRHTSMDIAELYSDKPFGWYANVGARSLWGYIIKPAGRLVTGTIASAFTATVATAGGAFEGAGRIVMATGDIAVMGTIVPAAKIVWHQPAYFVSLFNAEPKLEHDGKWGLHIVGHTPRTDTKTVKQPPPETEAVH